MCKLNINVAGGWGMQSENINNRNILISTTLE